MTSIDKNIFLNAAWKIGCELMKTSIWFEDSCTWQGYSIEPLNGQFSPVIKTFGSDIYSGTSGIALFLAALYSEKSDAILLKNIEGCVNQIKLNKESLFNHGFYTGKPGIASALLKIGKQFNREDWIKEGIILLKSIPTSSIQQHEIDLISGASGTIPILLDVYNAFGEKELLDKAMVLGDLLCDLAVKEGDIWSWSTVPSKINLTGFSHGASGIALAMLQLYTITKDKKYLQASIAGFNYERQTFDSSQQNWPDFRDDIIKHSEINVCSMAWCHGAPGIAISRFRANQLQPDAIYVQEMEIALRTTATNTYNTLMSDLNNTNFSLCHGVVGNADIMMDCGGEAYYQLAQNIGIAGINKYQENDISWPTGLNTNQYTPGLMMGIAGTGYFYLRLYDNVKHKTVLYSAV